MKDIKPRIMPRDLVDIIVFLLVCIPCQFLPLFGIPFLLGTRISHSVDFGLACVGAMYLLFLLFSVWSVRVSRDGVVFRRLLGNPKSLAWSEISSIRPAGRLEVIRHGWLWPLFPAREMSTCLSSKGHVRFDGPFGFCFFPPTQQQEFLTLARELCPSATTISIPDDGEKM